MTLFSARATLVYSLTAVVLTATGGCGTDADQDSSPSGPTKTVTVTPTPSSTPSTPRTAAALTNATQYARAIHRAVRSTRKVTRLTEKNDPNDLIGRPNGYMSAAVITDRQGDTSDPEPGVAYGATVESFKDAAGAKRRSDYIQGILKDAPMFGTEYHYLRDKVLLRVTGKLPPSVAKKYEAAFAAVAR